MPESNARKSPFGLNSNAVLPLKHTSETPVIEITKPIINQSERCFSFRKIWLIIAVKSGHILTITLTFEAFVK